MRSGPPLLLLLLLAVAHAMFPEEAGVNDWRLSFVGPPSALQFGGSQKTVLVATDDGVLASLYTATGTIHWRQALRTDHPLKGLHVADHSVLTLSGPLGESLHSWDPKTGLVQWQFSTGSDDVSHLPSSQVPMQLTSSNDADPWADEVDWHTDNSVITVLSGETLHQHSLQTGDQRWSVTLPRSRERALDSASGQPGTLRNKALFVRTDGTILVLAEERAEDTAVGASELKFVARVVNTKEEKIVFEDVLPGLPVGMACRVLAGSYVVCLHPDRALAHVLAADSLSTSEVPLEASATFVTLSQPTAEGGSPLLVACSSQGQYLVFTASKGTVSTTPLSIASTTQSVFLSLSMRDNKLLLVVGQQCTSSVRVSLWDPAILAEVPALTWTTSLPSNMTNITAAALWQSGSTFNLVVRTVAGDVSCLSGTGISWTREETLGAICEAVFADLPARSHDFDAFVVDGGPLTHYLTRLRTHANNLYDFISTGGNLLTDGEEKKATDAARPQRDAFNLHKRIVVVSRTGKLLGLDSETGAVAWAIFPRLSGTVKAAQLFVTRQPVIIHGIAVAVLSTSTGQHLVIRFDPTTGDVFEQLQLPYHLILAVTAPATTLEHEQYLLLVERLDGDAPSFRAHIYPAKEGAVDSVTKVGKLLMLHVIDVQQNAIYGLKVQASSTGTAGHGVTQTLPLTLTWDIVLPANERLAAIAPHREGGHEHVHSLGDVLTDRTVMHKYLNPHLLAVATLGPYERGSAHLSVYVLDILKGIVIASTSHESACGPIHLAQSENWLAYHYKNRKHKRYEIAMLEFFDAANQPPDRPFSSLDAPLPIVYNKTYVDSSAVTAMAVTTTSKGITHKMVLMGRPSGAIYGIHKRFLDARRPLHPGQTSYVEGLPPYHPQLPDVSYQTLNYNQTVERLTAIKTTASELESTCLYFAYGLDLHLNRVYPSKKFDVLNEDFNYVTLVSSLVFLAVGVAFLSRAAHRHQLELLWR